MEEEDDYDYEQDYWELYGKYRTLSWLKEDFKSRHQKSLVKENFLKKEIEGYDMVFDEKKLPLYFEELDYFCKPLSHYSIELFEGEIILIREAYDYFIFNGYNISESGSWEKRMNSYLHKECGNASYYIDLVNTLKEYQDWLKNFLYETSNPIIPEEYIRLIYKKYQSYFEKETPESWVARFYYNSDSSSIKPISVSKEAKEGSSKLILIAILAAIEGKRDSKFNYNDFVSNRFGIIKFDKMKCDHKEKETYEETFKRCNDILNI
jgi:hypothetical protein